MGQSVDMSAKEVSEHLLEVTGNALMSGTFGPFLDAFALPQMTTTHVSHLMSHYGRLVDPYPVLSVLERSGEGWKIISSDCAVSGHSPQGAALKQGATSTPILEGPANAQD